MTWRQRATGRRQKKKGINDQISQHAAALRGEEKESHACSYFHRACYLTICVRILHNQSANLLFRSDLTPTLPPQRPSQDPKAPVLQKQTPVLHYVSCFIHVLSSLFLLLFCSHIVLILNKVRWEFVSNAQQRDVMRARMCADLNAGAWVLCTPQKCHETDGETRKDRNKAKVMLNIVGWTESLEISFPRAKSDQPSRRGHGAGKRWGKESKKERRMTRRKGGSRREGEIWMRQFHFARPLLISGS